MVDELIADADSVDEIPIVIDGLDNCLGLALDLVDVKDAKEQFDVLALSCGDDVGDLIAVSTVETHDLVAADDGKIRFDL